MLTFLFQSSSFFSLSLYISFIIFVRSHFLSVIEIKTKKKCRQLIPSCRTKNKIIENEKRRTARRRWDDGTISALRLTSTLDPTGSKPNPLPKGFPHYIKKKLSHFPCNKLTAKTLPILKSLSLGPSPLPYCFVIKSVLFSPFVYYYVFSLLLFGH